MIDQEALNAALQAVADQFQVEIIGTATPIEPDVDSFDVKATPVVIPPSGDQSQ